MKLAIAMLALFVSATAASAQLYGSPTGNSQNSGGLYGTGSNPNSHYVQPHYNSNGSYTSGHHRTNPNNTQLDNYGTRGNYNPYTGSFGTRSPRY